MDHKVALVTGAARGLGRAMTVALLDKGVKVCIADVLEEVGKATTKELQEKYGQKQVYFVFCDVTKPEQFKDAWNKCEEDLGTPTLLVNNAGIGDEQNWKKTLDVNLGGCIAGTLLAMEKLTKKDGGSGGRVVNISSIAGIKTLPFGPIYSATKSGIVGFSRALGHPLHYSLTGVQVQCLCPSLAETTFIQEAMKTAFSDDIRKATAKITGTFTALTPETVAAAFVKLIEEGPNGAVLVVEGAKEPYYVYASQ
uniref:15-hydroxyprostaglandin dehydrogenase [NAD(+)] n=1 Tax=Hirondellea gigas TaxID=1518452 RepID=A0A2P2HZK9_9CRUS